MEAIILHPKNKTQLSILKNLAKEMGMSFETKKEESIKASISAKEKVMKLVFEGKGGYKLERESAKDKLVIGQSYQVEKIQVGGYSTDIHLTDISGSFNSCLFERDEYLEGLIHGNEESDGSFELVKSYFIFNILPKD